MLRALVHNQMIRVGSYILCTEIITVNNLGITAQRWAKIGRNAYTHLIVVLEM